MRSQVLPGGESNLGVELLMCVEGGGGGGGPVLMLGECSEPRAALGSCSSFLLLFLLTEH